MEYAIYYRGIVHKGFGHKYLILIYYRYRYNSMELGETYATKVQAFEAALKLQEEEDDSFCSYHILDTQSGQEWLVESIEWPQKNLDENKLRIKVYPK